MFLIHDLFIIYCLVHYIMWDDNSSKKSFFKYHINAYGLAIQTLVSKSKIYEILYIPWKL